MSSSAPIYVRGRVSPGQLAAAYHLRWARPCGALALAIVALQLTRWRRAPRWTIGVGVSVAYSAYRFRAHAYGALSPIVMPSLLYVVALALAVALSMTWRHGADHRADRCA